MCQQSFVEEKQLSEIALMTKPAVRESLYKLFGAGLASLQA